MIKPEKVHLENKNGRFEMTIQKAELKLRGKRVNPTATWKLPKDSDYDFDGTNLVKKKPDTKPTKEEKKEEKTKASE